jgi:hypothetical protein
MANQGGKTLHELNIRTLADELATATTDDNAQPGGDAYTVTWHIPQIDIDAGDDDRTYQLPAGKRARILGVFVNHVTEAFAGVTNATISFGESGGDVDEHVAAFLTTDITVDTNGDLRDGADDFTQQLVDGVLPVAVAGTLLIMNTITGATGTGIGDVNVILEIFT